MAPRNQQASATIRRENVNIRTWPTISPAHMPCGHPGAQELSHWDGPCSGFVCERCGSRRFLETAPRTCRRTRTAFDKAIVPILSSRQLNGLPVSTSCQPVNDRDQTALTILSPSPVQAMDRDCKSGRHPLWHCKFPQVLVTSANLLI